MELGVSKGQKEEPGRGSQEEENTVAGRAVQGLGAQ